jgi:hypothetical protein
VAPVLLPRLLLIFLVAAAAADPVHAYCRQVERSNGVIYVGVCEEIRRYDVASGEWLAAIPVPAPGCMGDFRVYGDRIFLLWNTGRVDEIGADGTVLATIQTGSGESREVGGGFLFTLASDGTLHSRALDGGAILAEGLLGPEENRNRYLTVRGNRLLVFGGEHLWSVAFDASGALAAPVELDPERTRDRAPWWAVRYGDGNLAVDGYGQVWDSATARHVEDLPERQWWHPLPDGGLLARDRSWLVRYDARRFPVAEATIAEGAPLVADDTTAYAFLCYEDHTEVEVLPIADLAPIDPPPVDPSAPYTPTDVVLANGELLALTWSEPWIRRYSLDGALLGAIRLSYWPSRFEVAADGSVIVSYSDGRLTQIPPGGAEAPIATVARGGVCDPVAIGDLLVTCGAGGARRYAFDRSTGALRGWRTAQVPTAALTLDAAARAGPSTVLECRRAQDFEIARYDVAPDGTFGAEAKQAIHAAVEFVRADPAASIAMVGSKIFDLDTLDELDAWPRGMEDAAVFGSWIAGIEAADHRNVTTYRERRIGGEDTMVMLSGRPIRMVPIGASEAILVRGLDGGLKFDRIHIGGADIDGDGVPNDLDFFDMDPTEQYDRDDDGVGDNADAFPDDGYEQFDRDGDGVGDNRDPLPDDGSGTIARLHGKPVIKAPTLPYVWWWNRHDLVLQLGSGEAFGLSGVVWGEPLTGTIAPANAAGTRLRLTLDDASAGKLASFLGIVERDAFASEDTPDFDVALEPVSLELKHRKGGRRVELRVLAPHHSQSDELGMAFRAKYRLRAGGKLEAPSGP